MRTITFNETTALKLYHEQKNDSEIGEAVGKNSNAIACWRIRRNLPCIAGNIRNNNQIHYSKVLNEAQQKEMNQFLKALSWAGKKAVQAGVKPDVGNFINGWRDIQR